MKCLKTLGLTVFVVGVLLAGAGNASATELTCTEPAGTKVMCPVGSVIHAVSAGHVVQDSLAGKIECNIALEGEVTITGGAGETVSVKLTSFAFNTCTASSVQVLKTGALEIHKLAGANNSTGTWSGAEMTVETFGVHCIFTTSNTDRGILTGSTTTQSTATLDIAATIPRTSGRSGAFCGSSTPWKGSFEVIGPDWLDIDP